MKDFVNLQRSLGLKKYLSSALGTLYFVPYAPGAPEIMVRHFDAALPPEFAPAYADLIRAAQRWIERHPGVSTLARIIEPSEVGDDYVVRPYEMYTSTNAYFDEDDPVEPPDEWRLLKAAVQSVPTPSGDRDAIVAEVVRRSLIEPNGKTFFDEDEGRFVVVEPKLTAADVRRWAALRE